MTIIDSLPTVNKFLFCFSVKCGTITIAIIGIVSIRYS